MYVIIPLQDQLLVIEHNYNASDGSLNG